MCIKLTSNILPKFMNNNKSVEILLDTGVTLSVFTDDEETLYKLFDNVIYTGYHASISGFGGKCNYCKVYVIPELSFGNVTLINLPVAIITMKNTKFDLVLSSNVFNKVPFTIDYTKRELRVDTVRINCRYNMSTRKENMISGFSVFVQN